MNIMDLFKEYLPIWAEENMQPIPTDDHPDRQALAWKDFQYKYLPKYYEEMDQEYKNMRLKTRDMKKKEKEKANKSVKKENKTQKTEESTQKQETKSCELSEWEKIQKLLD